MAEQRTGSEVTRPSFWELSWPDPGFGTWPGRGRLERLLGGLEDDPMGGVLSVTIRKAERAKPKTVEIRS
jgi:hypothetical protein